MPKLSRREALRAAVALPAATLAAQTPAAQSPHKPSNTARYAICPDCGKPAVYLSIWHSTVQQAMVSRPDCTACGWHGPTVP